MKTTIKIGNMFCHHCQGRAQKVLADFGQVEVDLATTSAIIISEERLSKEELAKALATINQTIISFDQQL